MSYSARNLIWSYDVVHEFICVTCDIGAQSTSTSHTQFILPLIYPNREEVHFLPKKINRLNMRVKSSIYKDDKRPTKAEEIYQTCGHTSDLFTTKRLFLEQESFLPSVFNRSIKSGMK